jgi:AAA15 family ATPase/GTPase
MFTYVKLKNYKSLIDLEVNLITKKNTPKNLVVIYGENGSGKSNFATSFFTLYEFLLSKSHKEILEELLEKNKEEIQLKNIKGILKDVKKIIEEVKTIGSKENMVLEFGFKINGKLGCYKIETNDSKIVMEKLDFVLNKNKTNVFELTENEIKINDKIFKKIEYKKELEDLIDKFFGKHTLLSILISETKNKKDGYISQRISKEIKSVIYFFLNNSIKLKRGYIGEQGKIRTEHKIFCNFMDMIEGQIKLENENVLEKTEKLLNLFFTNLYSDIKEVYYQKIKEGNQIKYTLFLKKKIYGRIIDIDFKLESTGTQALLELIPYIISVLEGGTVIIDEFDTGIHDLFVDKLLNDLVEIKGQLIITTHNTMLLESEIKKDNIYVFKIDEEGNKELLPITSFEERIHPNLNVRKRYLKGMYSGVPLMMDLDYNELLDTLN